MVVVRLTSIEVKSTITMLMDINSRVRDHKRRVMVERTVLAMEERT